MKNCTIEISVCFDSHYENDALVRWTRRVRVLDGDRVVNTGCGFETRVQAETFVNGLLMGLRVAGQEVAAIVWPPEDRDDESEREYVDRMESRSEGREDFHADG